MRLLLIRHAQSANNALPEHQRVEDPPLTELGHRQAAALAQWLESAELTRLIASPFRRSLETAEYIRNRLKLPAEVWVDLHEQGGCYSGFEPACYQGRPGMTRTQISAEFPGYDIETSIDHDGWWKGQPYESLEQAQQRARRLIARTIQQFAGSHEAIAYVMHADFKRLVLAEMFASTPSLINGDSASLYNTSVTQITLVSERLQLDRLNSVLHLPRELLSA